jgi:hypothetical protein
MIRHGALVGMTGDDFAITCLVALLFGLIVALLFDYARKPRLRFGAFDPVRGAGAFNQQGQQVGASFIRVGVETDYPLRFTRKYVMPQPALRARAELWFCDATCRLIGGRSMPGRWSGSPQPTPPFATGQVAIAGQVGQIRLRHIDVNVLGASSLLDIYPDAPETLDIAVGLDGDPVAYGWSNENYRGNWMWALPVGETFVAIEIKAIWARGALGVFAISNPGAHRNLQIRRASPFEEMRVLEGLGLTSRAGV